MARTNRFSSRLDVLVFGACVMLSLAATVLPSRLREPVASVLRRTLVAPLVRLQQGAERWRGAYLSSQREELRRDTLALGPSARSAMMVSRNAAPLDQLRAWTRPFALPFLDAAPQSLTARRLSARWLEPGPPAS